MKNKTSQRGFTLLEIILVLALIGGIASVILPSLRVTIDSQMSVSIKNLSSQIHAAYDNAIFTGHMQRLVLNIRSGEFWVEQAPPNFSGRPPLIQGDKEKDQLLENNKKAFLDMLDEKEKNSSDRKSPYGSEDNPTFYTSRSIPVIQKNVLIPKNWTEVSDAIISKHSLSGSVIFAKYMSELSPDAFEYSTVAALTDPKETKFGYIYFLPDGTATSTSIQLAIKSANNSVSENDLKYTLNLNTLTGQINLIEGFQDANFKLPKR